MEATDIRLTRNDHAAPWRGGRTLKTALLLTVNGGLLTLMLSRMAQAQGLSPVVFSLLGHIALVFGLLLGMIFLGESYGALVFSAVLLMGVGLASVISARS